MDDERPDWLPEGWMVGVKIGGFGARVKYYSHPTNGLVFYSKPAVFRYINGEVHTPQKRSKKHSKVKQDKSSRKAEEHSPTVTKEDGIITRSKTIVSERKLRSFSKGATMNVPDDFYVDQTVKEDSPPVERSDKQLVNTTEQQADAIVESKEVTKDNAHAIIDGDQSLKSGLKADLPEKIDDLTADQTANNRRKVWLEGVKNQKENISANQSIKSGSKVIDRPEPQNSEEKAYHTGDQQRVGKRKKSMSSLPSRQLKRNQSGKSNKSNKTTTVDEAKHLTGLKEPMTLPVGDLSWIKAPKQNVKNEKQPDLCVEDYALEDSYIGKGDLLMEYLNKIGDFAPSVSLKDILDYPCMRFAVKTLLSEGELMKHVKEIPIVMNSVF